MKLDEIELDRIEFLYTNAVKTYLDSDDTQQLELEKFVKDEISRAKLAEKIGFPLDRCSIEAGKKFINYVELYKVVHGFVTELGLSFHPDTDFKDYVDGDGKKVFSKLDAKNNNKTLEKWISKNPDTVYQLTLDILDRLNLR